MGTTARGYPYPEDAPGVPNQVPLDLEALAEAVDADLTSSLGALSGTYLAKALADAAGDLLVADAADSFARLAKGADGTVLGVAAGTVGWQVPDAGAVALISRQVLGAAAASVQFAAIPGTYESLMLVVSDLRGSGAGTTEQIANIFLNGDTTTANYRVQLAGALNGSASNGANDNPARLYFPGGGVTAGYSGAGSALLPGYSRGSLHKSVMAHVTNRFGTLNMRSQMDFAQWENVAAVTQVDINSTGESFAAGSVFALYGIEGS